MISMKIHLKGTRNEENFMTPTQCKIVVSRSTTYNDREIGKFTSSDSNYFSAEKKISS